MKTHDFAKALRELARVLSTGPNVEVSDLDLGKPLRGSRTTEDQEYTQQLQAMFSLDKHQLISFIQEFSLPVEVRPRDGGRDVLAKIQKCLSANPKLWRRVRTEMVHGDRPVSPALRHALSILLKDRE